MKYLSYFKTFESKLIDVKTDDQKFIQELLEDRYDYSIEEMNRVIEKAKELNIDPLKEYKYYDNLFERYDKTKFISLLPIGPWLNTYEMQKFLINANPQSLQWLIDTEKRDKESYDENGNHKTWGSSYKYPNNCVIIHPKTKEENSWYFESEELGLLENFKTYTDKYNEYKEVQQFLSNLTISDREINTGAYNELVELIKKYNIDVTNEEELTYPLIEDIPFHWLGGTKLAKAMIDVNTDTLYFLTKTYKRVILEFGGYESDFFDEFSYLIDSDELGLL